MSAVFLSALVLITTFIFPRCSPACLLMTSIITGECYEH